MKTIKRIGVLTSGGDAPGMNAAIRAVTRTAISHNLEVYGIRMGYYGVLNSDWSLLDKRSVANIIQRGGTVLKTGRCLEFMQADQRKHGAENLKKQGIEALVCIGGDGTFRGAHALSTEHNIPVIGVPGTIDNDIFGTDRTIGFDTAVNTALDAIDRIRDTAASHNRLFIVEVMGRDSGFIALEVGLAGGAEFIFIPENPTTVDQAVDQIKTSIQSGKTSSIIITAEGQKPGRAYDLAESIRKKAGFEAKVCVLGHIQRGGVPTAMDRNLASRLGSEAVEALLQGHHGKMVGVQNGKVVLVPFDVVVNNKKLAPKELLPLVKILSQ
jgi:6-phosphofructokinase 1